MWAFGVWALCLVAGTAGHIGHDRTASGRHAPLAAAAILDPAGDHAVLPARVAGEVRVADHAGPARGLMVAAILAMLVGGSAAIRGRGAPGGTEVRNLRIRRHDIALRAPPLRLA
jgi:hypothetical protein